MDTSSVLDRLTEEWESLTQEAQKAARYVLDNPQDVGVSTVRELAEAAKVKPNTVVRMARQVGFEGFEEFRAPFRDAIRMGAVSLEDRARWLQDIGKEGELGGLYADIVAATIQNIEETFAGIDIEDIQSAAQDIWQSNRTFVLGVGVNNANARNFTYLASTGMSGFQAIPSAGMTALDDLARADARDVLVAMTTQPYRRDVVEAVRFAKAQGVTVIALSDSLASPISLVADHKFTISQDTPQFFPSSVATVALLETLLSFVVSVASDKIVNQVEQFHLLRHKMGAYEGGE